MPMINILKKPILAVVSCPSIGTSLSAKRTSGPHRDAIKAWTILYAKGFLTHNAKPINGQRFRRAKGAELELLL